ncbi:hypothetical protein Ddc_12963 [Ditylenchus destructor]|nr:hypothetical protein Ddc_12963 [Ditylenchus destructor]
MQDVNMRFNLTIQREFKDSPPYLIFRKLWIEGYKNHPCDKSEMCLEGGISVPVTSTVLQHIAASKFIRFDFSYFCCDENFHPNEILPMSHIWENRALSVRWDEVDNFRATEEFLHSFGSCLRLTVKGSNAISIFHGLNVAKYDSLTLYDYDNDPDSKDIPWEKISHFLFRAFADSKSYNSINIHTCYLPNLERALESIDSMMKQKFGMNSKPIPVLHYDTLRDILANFDRKTLCRLQDVNIRFNLIIDREFKDSPPYLVFRKLWIKSLADHTRHLNDDSEMWVGSRSSVPVTSTVLQNIAASRFIRFDHLYFLCNEHFHPNEILPMSHAWENGVLSLLWYDVDNFRATEQFLRYFGSCQKLVMDGSNAISILHELNVAKYRRLQIWDKDYNPDAQEIPWTKILDFLFRGGADSDKPNHIEIDTNQLPNLERALEFVDSVKKRFETAEVALNFSFVWHSNHGPFENIPYGEDEHVTFPSIDVQNNRTKQHFEVRNNRYGLRFFTS